MAKEFNETMMLLLSDTPDGYLPPTFAAELRAAASLYSQAETDAKLLLKADQAFVVASFAAVDAALATKADLASPTFSGTPSAPTPATNDLSAHLATTAFVNNRINSVYTAADVLAKLLTVDGPGSGLDSDKLGGVASSAYALLASPSFTGTPNVPNITAGANDTRIANTQFVNDSIAAAFTSNLTAINVLNLIKTVDGAGSGLDADTFQGLTPAAFATVASLSAYAPLASPALTGTPTATTATPGDSTTRIATTAFVSAADALKANVASPTFTGTPAAPTATPGTNTTQLATTAFVAASFAPLASPAFTGTPTAPTATGGTNTTQIATTAFVTGALSAYAPLASPALTGNPTAPTQTAGNNSTRVATTAFVLANSITQAFADAAYAPFGSPAFTGTPTAPTATGGTNTTQIATTAFVQAALTAGAYAPLASPAFTGTPTAPTQAAGNNSTRLATTAFVATSFATIASPTFTGTPNSTTPTAGDSTTRIATTAYVQGELGTYAPLASAALTGTPTAPTQTLGNNSTRLATTAFVQAAINNFFATPTTWSGLQNFTDGIKVGAAAGVLWSNDDGITYDDVGNLFSMFSDGAVANSYFEAGRIRATSGSDVSISTTSHGFQIGPSTGLNLRADVNEIFFVNNGVLSTGFINATSLGLIGDVAVSGDVLINSNGNAISIVASTDTNDPYISFSKTIASVVTRQGYIQHTDGTGSGAGFRFYNDVTGDVMYLSNVNTVDALKFYDSSVASHNTVYHSGNFGSTEIVAALGYTPVTNARQVIAGNGLTGGGALTADRTLTVGTPTTLTATTTNTVTTTSHAHAVNTLSIVADGIAQQTAGGVGTYAMLNGPNGNPGTTAAGSGLAYTNGSGSAAGGSNPAGTWMRMGLQSGTGIGNLWMRVS